MPPRIEYRTGEIIGSNNIKYIKEIEPQISSSRKTRRAEFLCFCGKIFQANIQDVRRGKTKSCGCYRKKRSAETHKKNIAGQRYGRLVALEPTEKRDGSHIIWKCICDCGNIYYVSLNNLTSKATQSCGCLRKESEKDCSNKYKLDLTNKRFGKLVALYPTEKRSSQGSVIWHCICDCGNEKDVRSTFLTRGETISCGCTRSKGESLISQLLTKLNINFINQYWFNDCRNKKTNYPLRFDFYLPNYNTCIEYDGKQHFEPIDYFGGEERLIQQQEQDNIKNQYCKNNNIKLIRIPYYDYNKLNEKYLRGLINDSISR